MRIKRFANFSSTLKSSRANLVNEFLDVSTAADHEFSREIDRQRYARYIHAVGCLSYGQKFVDDLEAEAVTVEGDGRVNIVDGDGAVGE